MARATLGGVASVLDQAVVARRNVSWALDAILFRCLRFR